ncbi:MAG: PorV/PorQ family protein [Bacteroidia bacterium]|nr:PorV/PorQ family protein [Bacteroidia bacterium]
MKNKYKNFIALLLIGFLLLPSIVVIGGNKDRSGEAGASELLINPWARSAGWGGANVASVRGLESSFVNVAGIAFTNRTEVGFTHTQWLVGSDINMYAVGFSQKLTETGRMAVNIINMSFGSIPITTTDNPEGDIGTFNPNYFMFALSYANVFSNSIYGGLTVKLISENISDMSATGFAIDAGIQYVTGVKENVKFGITLKNWGTSMSYNGDGLSIRTLLPGTSSQFTLEQRSASFELPSQLLIGGAYDILFPKDYRLTVSGTFISNAFSKDQIVGGLEFSLKDLLVIRGGYTYESDIATSKSTTLYTGPSFGATINVPFNKEIGSGFAIDYSYRDTNPWNGIHSIGIVLDF